MHLRFFFYTLLSWEVPSPVGWVAISSKGTSFHFNADIFYYTDGIWEFSVGSIKDDLSYCLLPLKYWNPHVQHTYWCLMSSSRKLEADALSTRHQVTEHRHWSGLILRLPSFGSNTSLICLLQIFPDRILHLQPKYFVLIKKLKKN